MFRPQQWKVVIDPVETTKQETIIYTPPSYVDRLDLTALFGTPRPLEVELGAGDGSFILEWAALNRDVNFIAVERLLGRLMKIEKRGRRAGLANLRGMRIEIGYFTEYLLPRGLVTAFHIYFPDPWPKKRHRQNRLIQEHYTSILAQALVPGGTVYLRTDDLDYFEQMLAVFAASAAFAPVETPETLKNVKTDFERAFNAQGIPTHYAAYRTKA